MGPTSSARSVLLTLLGDVVLPCGGATGWLGAVTHVMGELGFPATTVRQALRRLAAQGMVAAERHGRMAAYGIADEALPRMEEAAERIYRAGPPAWDGRWRLLTSTFEEAHRSSRDALRRELGWLGYGSLGTSSYACPWDHGRALAAVLAKHGAKGSVDTFTAVHDGDDRELAARVYDLDALDRLHADFVARFTDRVAVEGAPDAGPLARRVALVHEWRRTLFLDPGLPDELVPEGWRGVEAGALFTRSYAALERPAWQEWRDLTAANSPDGEPASVPAGSVLD